MVNNGGDPELIVQCDVAGDQNLIGRYIIRAIQWTSFVAS